MKRLLCLLFLIPNLIFAQEITNPLVQWEELDGSPSAYPYQILVPNDSMTATGGVIELTFGGGGGGGGSGTVTSISQGTGVTCTPNPITDTGTIAIGQAVGTGDNVTFTNVTTTNVVTSPVVQITGLTTNGLVKTYGSVGNLGIDTNTYLTSYTETDPNVDSSAKIQAILGVASSGVNGYLLGTDWDIFNGKESVLSFTGALSRAVNTVSIVDAAADDSTKGAASFNINDFDSSSGNISIDYTNGQAASGSNKGFLTSANWTTFNGKADYSFGANDFSGTGYFSTTNTATSSVVCLKGGTYNTYISPSTPTASIYYQLPLTDGNNGYQLTTNGKAVLSWEAPGGAAGATAQLDNLSSVAINTSLLPGVDNSIDLGSTAKSFKDAYIDGTATAPVVDLQYMEYAAGSSVTIRDNLIVNGTATVKDTTNISGQNKHLRFNILTPSNFITTNSVVCLIPKLDAAIKVTNLEVTCNADPNLEPTGDIKYADSFIGLANAAVIETFDTTAGARTDDSIASPSVAAGKCIYLLFDTALNSIPTQISFDLTYDYD